VPALAARRTWLIAVVLLALIVVVLFGGRAAWRLGRRLTGPPPPPPRQTDVSQIAEWMSVPFISRGYRVPEAEIFRALGIDPEGRRMRPLREIADETGRSSDEVVEIVRQTVTTWQAEHSRPPPGGPDAKPDGAEPRPDGAQPKPERPEAKPDDAGRGPGGARPAAPPPALAAP
jgi:hypothetical protein